MWLLIIYVFWTVLLGGALAYLWVQECPKVTFKLWWFPHIQSKEAALKHNFSKWQTIALEIVMNLLYAPATLFALLIVGIILLFCTIVFLFSSHWLKG